MSTAQLSLLIFEDDSPRGPLLQDLQAFFQKFAVPYEIIWLPREQQNLAGFFLAAEHTQGQILLTLNGRLSSPLGDLFKLMESLHGEEPAQIVFGERLTKGGLLPRWEQMAAQVLREKKSPVLKDPFAEFMAFRKELLPLLRVPPRARQRDFITAHLQKQSLRQGLNWKEISLHSRQGTEKKSQHPFWKLFFLAWFF